MLLYTKIINSPMSKSFPAPGRNCFLGIKKKKKLKTSVSSRVKLSLAHNPQEQLLRAERGSDL